MPFTANKAVLPVLPKPEILKHGMADNIPLSAIEDKELRKKLRNRQSALAARERKKARMLELERQVMELQESHKLLEHENHFLYSRLGFMKQKCLEAGVSLDDEKDVPHLPYNHAFCSENFDLGNNRFFSNNFDHVPNLKRPPPLPGSESGYPTNHQNLDFSTNCSSYQVLPKNTVSSKENNEKKFSQHQANVFHHVSPPFNRSSSDYFPDSAQNLNPPKFENNTCQMKIKQEEFETAFSKDANTFKGNVIVNRTVSYPPSDQSRHFYTPIQSQPTSPFSTLPSIEAMMETGVQENATAAMSWNNFVKNPSNQDEFGKQKFGASFHTKYRNETSPYTFKKSRSFHSLNIMSTACGSSKETHWGAPNVHKQCNNNYPPCSSSTSTSHPNSLLSSPVIEKNSTNNNFLNFFGPNPKSNLAVATLDVGNNSKTKLPDHSSSDSGLSMDDHLEWIADSSLFDI